MANAVPGLARSSAPTARAHGHDRAARNRPRATRIPAARTARRAASQRPATRATRLRARRSSDPNCSRQSPEERRARRLLRPAEDDAQRPLPPHEGALRHRPAVPDLALRRRPHEVPRPGPQRRSTRRRRARTASVAIIGSYLGTAKCTNPLFAAKLPREAGDEICTPASAARARPTSSSSPSSAASRTSSSTSTRRMPDDSEPHRQRRLGRRSSAGPGQLRLRGHRPAHGPVGRAASGTSRRRATRAATTAPATTSTAATGDTRDERPAVRMHVRRCRDERTCTAMDPSCDCAEPGEVTRRSAARPSASSSRRRPTRPIREFMVVRALGDQGVVASLCPITLEGDKQSPTLRVQPGRQGDRRPPQERAHHAVSAAEADA